MACVELFPIHRHMRVSQRKKKIRNSKWIYYIFIKETEC